MAFNYKNSLRESFWEKKSRNPNYSLRAFSRDIGVSLTALSDVMSGKRNFSEKNAVKVAHCLNFTPEQTYKMMVEVKRRANNIEKEVDKKVIQLKEDEFALISKWYYLALLTLCKQKKVSSNPKVHSKRLGIKLTEAKNAIATLKRLGFIEEKAGQLKRRIDSIETTTNIPSHAIKNYQKENLEVAKNAIDNIPLGLREICSMNLNIDPKKIKKAKKMINQFMDEFTEEMEKTSPKEVYTFAMHFFPATLSKESEAQ